MALKLKLVLADLGLTQADLADATRYSPKAIAGLCDRGEWQVAFNELGFWSVLDFLEEHGATDEQLEGIFDEHPETEVSVGGE